MLFGRIIEKIFNLKRNTSIIILNGGIGNQIFQYFLGKELSNNYGRNVVFYDLRKSYRVHHNSHIENLFEIKLKKFNSSKSNFLFSFILLSPLFLKLNKLFFEFFGFKLIPNFYLEKSINIKNYSGNNGFEVFFGTWHYLINNYKLSKKSKLLIFKENFKLPSNFNFEQEFIGLHVRRGDYVSSKKTARYHGKLKKSYFIKSVKYIRNKFGDLPVLLFSDDHEWLGENLKKIIPNSFVISSNLNSAEKDLFFMTKAKYFVLSNSTFSWCGAFLSNKKNKFIIIPKYWFRNFETTKDYIYKDWNYKII